MDQISRPRRPKLVLDAIYPYMWRVQWPDGRLSDMANLTRAKDAIACFIETAERRQRGRQKPSEGRLCVKMCAGDGDLRFISSNAKDTTPE